MAFFGTPEFAVATLERLLAERHPVVCVVSQPDRPRGRGRRLHPSPVSELALGRGIPLLRPERVGTAEVAAQLREHAADLGVVVAFGQFLPRRIRELPGRGYLINAHASLLPANRGAAPIVHAILCGDARTGISVMRVEREMDAGPVALVRELEIGPDETAGTLGERLARLAADAVVAALEQIAEGSLRWTPQDDARASYAPKIERADARLDWNQQAEVLARRVRAMAPTPGAFTTRNGELLRVLAASEVSGPTGVPPGTVRLRTGETLQIATGDGWLVPTRLQHAGAKVLDVAAYLRGRPFTDGDRLGDLSTAGQ